jgi:HlyD family secretion protein
MARREDRITPQPEHCLKRLLWIIPLAAIIGGAFWTTQKRDSAVTVRVVHPRRERLVSTLTSNAKVEPIEWSPVRVESPGLVIKLPIRLGDNIAKGALIAQVSDTGAPDQLKAAEARTAQVQADLDTLSKGGKNSLLTDIQNQIDKTKLSRDVASREYGSLKRLYDKQAATLVEVETAHNKLRDLELELESLAKQRTALVGQNDVSTAQARLQESKAAERLAELKIGQGIIRSPMAGVVYNLPARLGAYLNVGDLVANIGRLDELRIKVYVDEPELGRVAVGQPVKITWDALPAKTWTGKVERMPTEIVPLGTRQVGEVLCTIANPQRELVPGTNVNAEIETIVVDNALTIPKEALHYERGIPSVFLIEGAGVVRMRKVGHGSDSVTRAQITSGLDDGAQVVLPSESLLKDGDKVKVIQEP